MVNNISPQQAHEWLMSGDAVLIDVREADEFQNEHIAYAFSLPLSSIHSDFSMLDIPPSRKIIFQCLKGARGEKACALISEQDYCSNDIYNIEGGISAWKEDGFPLVSKIQSQNKSAGIPIMRQVQMAIGAVITFLIFLGLTGIAAAFIFAGFISLMFFFAGLTGWCGLSWLLSKMPWNK